MSTTDYTFVWVAEGQVMTGQPKDYARAIEECYYGGFDLGDLHVLVVYEHSPVPAVRRVNVRKEPMPSVIDTYFGRLYVTDPSGFIHEADYRLDLRA